ncbi:hypothetical protein C2S51_004422 [Perilla frutescens var. frutescens]|nr:hypothetical protein C2S51_004422 [Perilla frutescens var. frutescens]
MAVLQLKVKLFLLLTTLSFCCQAKNSTVKVVGLIHCTHDCGIRNHSSSSNASNLGLDVVIICKGGKSNETKTQGNGGVDEHGKFNVTLSDPTSSIDGCYAKLKISNSSSSSSSSPNCPIQASLNIVPSNEIVVMNNRPTTIIEFSPITCQSAFFWPFPNLTFFASPPPPPPEYTPPPQPQPQPQVASPVQPPQPSYDDPPSPEIGAPSPPPTPPPTYQNLPSPTTSPQAPPPLPLYTEPSPPLLPPAPKSPTPALSPPSLPPPSRRRPNPIPRAPPIPRLPVTPSVPRKYFNAPKSKSKPPRYD